MNTQFELYNRANLIILKRFFENLAVEPHPDRFIIEQDKVVDFQEKIDPQNKDFETWFENLLYNDEYQINLFAQANVNDHVNPIFHVNYLDNHIDVLYFIDRFAPDYRFDADRIKQIMKQIQSEIDDRDQLTLLKP